MSTFKVPFTTIREILPHDNADKLEIAKVYDWNVIVRKGLYKAGDKVVYCPVDSILPQDLEYQLFPIGSKITLNKHRIRSIKIRGSISQGMIIEPSEVLSPRALTMYNLEDDLSGQLGITKYEPPVKDIPRGMQAKKKRAVNPNFSKYTDIENFKYYDRLFQDGEEVYISEKLHGTSFRAGWFPNEANTLWKKVLKLFGMLPKWEFCWGSRQVQIQSKYFHRGFYDVDVYTKIVKQCNLHNMIPKGYAVYGEIVGDGIQKNYTYGCKSGEHDLYVYDVRNTIITEEQKLAGVTGTWLDYSNDLIQMDFKALVDVMGLKRVPLLYVGPFSKEIADRLRLGDSKIGGQKVSEGIVIKPIKEATSPSIGRKVLKHINPDYYLMDNDDFH